MVVSARKIDFPVTWKDRECKDGIRADIRLPNRGMTGPNLPSLHSSVSVGSNPPGRYQNFDGRAVFFRPVRNAVLSRLIRNG